MRARHLLPLIALAVLAYVPLAHASFFAVQSWCKCTCFSNSTVIPINFPTDPRNPCTTCTRQWCLDQKLIICKGADAPPVDNDTGTGTEGDVEARCFKRDSPRDQIIVTCFLLIVCGLLLFAGVRARLRHAIAERGQPRTLQEWSDALLPTSFRRRAQGRNMRSSAYAPVSVGS